MDINSYKVTQSLQECKISDIEIESLNFKESELSLTPEDISNITEFKNLDNSTLNQLTNELNRFSSLIALICSKNL